MLKTMLIHEIRCMLRSHRVLWSIAIFILLFMVIFTIRFQDFATRQQNYITNQQMIQEIHKSAGNYSDLQTLAVHPPVLFSIYHEGAFVRRGHVIINSFFEQLSFTEQGFSEPDRFFKDNIKMDVTTLITFFLSLFILLNAFDSINFEKQAGTLRLLTTFPIKRSEYLMGKIIGITLFVLCVLTIPLLLSLIPLFIKFSSLMTGSFFLQFFSFYLFSILFILIFVLIGILCSLLTKSIRKSLAYALFFWLGLILIFPTVIAIIMSPLSGVFVDNQKRENIQKQIEDNRMNILRFEETYPDSIAPWNQGHMCWNGWVYNHTTLFVTEHVFKTHIDYLRKYYNDPYQKMRQNEELRFERDRMDYWYIRNENLFNFYNPVSQFTAFAENISGCANEDYNDFVKEGIRLRDKLVDQGIRDGWLFSKSYFAEADTSLAYDNFEWVRSFQQINDILTNQRFKFSVPDYEKYQYHEITIGKIIRKGFTPLFISIIMIIALFTINLNLYKKYDVR